MAASFLHGVETLELQSGSAPISVVRSSVIALAGIAPKGPKNELTLVTSPKDAAQFGKKTPGFNIPYALDIIFKQGSATVLVVNVFDANIHTVQVSSENQTLTKGKIKTQFAPIGDVTVKDQTGTITYVSGTDYTIDDYGNLSVVANSAMHDGQVLGLTYKKLDSSAVTSANIIGEINGTTGTYTGMQLFDLSYSMFSFKPKIIIIPEYSTVSAIAAEMITKANKYRAHCIIDAPADSTVQQVIQARSPFGTWTGFNSYNKRVIATYPMWKVYDAYSNTDIKMPYSALLAGVISKTDNDLGYWYSPSNKEAVGITGVEKAIQFDLTDATCEANQINAVGVVTSKPGNKTWGNYSAAFPNSTAPESFICVQRTADVVDESIEYFVEPYLDRPLDTAFIDFIRESVSGFIRNLIGRGALLPGSECIFDAAKNPSSEIAQGHLTFTNRYAAPTPAGRVTFEREINIDLYNNVIPK